ncbi:hypothetical protein LCGC14_1661890 [marine sediment metagenome]|uniref:Uncharacterized protein n=1 Tax=marine sediment metagenome TaxID=412755 RepID=A0A0F9K9P5_9ZZZZ
MKPSTILVILWYITLIIISITISLFFKITDIRWLMIMLSITFFGGVILVSIVTTQNKFWKMKIK